jgi:hypothetical protein
MYFREAVLKVMVIVPFCNVRGLPLPALCMPAPPAPPELPPEPEPLPAAPPVPLPP